MSEPEAASQTRARLSSGTKLLFQILVTLLVIAFIFGGLELSLRVYQHKRLGSNALEPQALRDRFTAWRNNPAYGRVDIQHNHQGFRRDRNVSLEKPRDTVRIFFLGGSAAYGAAGVYPEIDNRYSRIYNNQLIDYYLEHKLNAAFPSRRWEVINAATNGYRIHQQLALIESVLLRYHPDYVISMDGYNDVIKLYNDIQEGKATNNPDIYAATLYADDFNSLANPRTFHSILVFAGVWLRANSALFRAMQDRLPNIVLSLQPRPQTAQREPGLTVQSSDPTAKEQAAVAVALSGVRYYTHVARQIHRVLELDGIQAVFLLQPELILTRKPLADSEKRLRAFDLKIGGPLYLYTFDQMYSVIGNEMSTAAEKDGFRFLNLQAEFDQNSEQTFSDFAHLTPQGNQVIANRLFEFLRDSFAEKARPAD